MYLVLEEKGTTEDEMVGWHHRLNGHGLDELRELVMDKEAWGWTPGVSDGQGDLAPCDSWGRKELDMTEQLNWTELYWRMSEDEICLHS